MLLTETEKTERRLAFLLGALLLLSLVPVAAVALYAHPSADDFSYGAQAAAAWRQGGGLPAVLRAAWQRTAEAYASWQGSFCAVFLMCLQPAVFGEWAYPLGCLFLLASYLGGVSLFLYALFRRCLGCGRAVFFLVLCTVLLLSLQFTYDPVESFFWYNGGVYYTFFYSLMLSMLGLLLLCWRARRPLAKGLLFACALPLALAVGGGNYVTALESALLLFCAACFLLWRRDRRAAAALVLLAALAAAMLASMAAPGNGVRQAAEGTPSAARGIALALVYGAYALCSCTTLPAVAGWLFLTPFLYRLAARSPFRFRRPLLVALLSFCLFAAQAAPPFYAMGLSMPERIINIVCFSYYPFFLLNLFYVLGWLSRREGWNRLLSSLRRGGVSLPLGRFALAVGCVFLCAVLGAVQAGKEESTGGLKLEHLPLSAQAALSLATGEAQAYDAQLEDRLAQYQDESQRDVLLEPLREKPYLLYFEDVTEDPSHWRNRAAASFYGKDSVRLR